MIVKSGGVMYLFNFDGTLFGSTRWSGFMKNTTSCLQNGPYLNPTDHGVRWCVLSDRTRLDKPFIWYMCHSRGLHPEYVLTSKRWRRKGIDQDTRYQEKVDVIKDILDRRIKLGGFPMSINKIFYIDNDLECVKYLNGKREGYQYHAITVVDFAKENFNIYI